MTSTLRHKGVKYANIELARKLFELLDANSGNASAAYNVVGRLNSSLALVGV